MRTIIKTIVFNAVAIYFLSLVYPGVKFSNPETLFYAALTFGFLNIFVKPILKLLTFPLNVLTFGLFSSLLNVLMIYLVTLMVPNFSILPFSLGSFNLGGISFPSLYFSTFWAYFTVSLSLSVVVNGLWFLLA